MIYIHCIITTKEGKRNAFYLQFSDVPKVGEYLVVEDKAYRVDSVYRQTGPKKEKQVSGLDVFAIIQSRIMISYVHGVM